MLLTARHRHPRKSPSFALDEGRADGLSAIVKTGSRVRNVRFRATYNALYLLSPSPSLSLSLPLHPSLTYSFTHSVTQSTYLVSRPHAAVMPITGIP